MAWRWSYFSYLGIFDIIIIVGEKMPFKKNIGKVDRVIRFVFGVLLLGLAWWWESWILLAFALFCFYEALASWCFYYQLIGKNTCPTDSDKY